MRACSKWLWLILPLGLYGTGIGFALIFGADWSEKQTWAVILTGVILIWYTWETMLLRRVAVGQRELQLRPFVVFQKANGGYVVENIGGSAALDVRVESITLIAPEIRLDIAFPRAVPLLKSGATATIEVTVDINGRRSDPNFAAHLDPNYAVQDVDLHMRFRNLEGKEYELVQVIAPKTVSIQGFRN